MKLNELIELCTTLQSRVLNLEQIKTTQANKIDSLKRRVKKLEKKQRSRTQKLKRLYKAKAKGIVFHKPEESTTTITATIPKPKSLTKGKAIMIEEPMKLKKKDQIMLDKEVALKLQAKFDNEQRLAREKAQKEE
nr:hypothetical protein [Tanacetum cinerariifolium]